MSLRRVAVLTFKALYLVYISSMGFIGLLLLMRLLEDFTLGIYWAIYW